MSESDRTRRLWRAGMTFVGLAIAVAAVLTVVTRERSQAPRATEPTRPSSSPSTASSTTPGLTTTTPGPISTTAAPAAPAPAQPAPTTEQFGASVNLLFNSATSTPQLIAAQLDALRATGVTLARSDALWEATEPTAPVGGVHSFDWAFDDRIAGDLASRGLRWLPILGYSASWAQSIPGQDHSPPSSSADYAAYAGAFAARYGPGGTFWQAHPRLEPKPVAIYEIWNEPDNGEFWTPTPDPARYADLYITAREAIDSADPSARVIVGGLTHPTGFLPAMLAVAPQLRGHVDGVAVHPYGPPAVVLAKLKADRATLAGLGMADVPLYATEFGWTTSPPGARDYAAPARRPAYISLTVAALGHLDCGLAASMLYTWYSPRQDPADKEQWYGIDSLTGARTADTVAFAQALVRARAPGPTLRICG